VTTLEREYRFLIARAEKEGDHKLAEQLREWALLKYDLDLTDSQNRTSLKASSAVA